VFSKQRVKYYYTIDVKYFLNYQRENEWTSNYIDNFTENKKKFTALFYYAMCVCVHVCVCVCVCEMSDSSSTCTILCDDSVRESDVVSLLYYCFSENE
jgi:hypothetical protein